MKPFTRIDTGAFFGFLAVALDFFGVHRLKLKVTVNALPSLETAARYQIYDALSVTAYNG